MKKIITDIEQLLEPSSPLTFLTETGMETTEGSDIIKELKEVMLAEKEILALSAPQIGIKKRIFCLRFDDTIKVFINPIITKKKGLKITVETCASMPGKEIVIGRPEEITVVYYNEDFKYEDNKLIGAAACFFDQQAQILDGVFPDAVGLVSDIEADGKIEDADLEDIIPFYTDTYLPQKLAMLRDQILADAEAEKAFKQLKLTEDVINGRVTIVEPKHETLNRAKAKKAAKKTLINLQKTEKANNKIQFNNYIKQVTRKK